MCKLLTCPKRNSPQIRNALTKANWSADAIEAMFNNVPWNFEALQEKALFVKARTNKTIAEMEDWSIERCLKPSSRG